jgi:hypothetical protein
MRIANNHSKLEYFIEHELLTRGHMQIKYTVSTYTDRFMISFKTKDMLFCTPEYYAVYNLNQLIFNETEILKEIEDMIKELRRSD